VLSVGIYLCDVSSHIYYKEPCNFFFCGQELLMFGTISCFQPSWKLFGAAILSLWVYLSKLNHRYIRNDTQGHMCMDSVVSYTKVWGHTQIGTWFSALFCLPLPIKPCYKLPKVRYKSSITWNPWCYIKNRATFCIFLIVTKKFSTLYKRYIRAHN
jgi:hypothetical protein